MLFRSTLGFFSSSSCTMKYWTKIKYYYTDTVLFGLMYVKHRFFFTVNLSCVNNNSCMLCFQAEALVQYLEEPLTQVAAS